MRAAELRRTNYGIIATEYAFREGLALHTDIESDLLSEDFSAFGRVNVATTLPASISNQGWLQRAVCRFALTFGIDSNPSVLQFFSDADALSHQLRWNEFAISSTALVTAGLALPDRGLPLTVTGFAEHGVTDADIAESSDQVVLPRQLCAWLDITYDQLSGITGVSRATFFNWRQPGAQPRPNNLQRVQRLYALISLLIKRFGVRGTRTWLHSSEDHTWDHLVAGDLAAVEESVRARLFGQPAADDRHNELPLDEVHLDLPATDPSTGRTPRRAARQPTRGRLATE